MSESASSGVSRRAFVTGVATAAAGVATVGVARADQANSWVWRGSDWRMVRPASAGAMPDRGARTGSFRSVPLGGGAHLHLFSFDDGMLIGLGRGLSMGAYAVVGGTGRFAGISGAYVAEQTPATTGNEGTALFTITPQR